MASISKDKDGRYRVQFVAPNGSRKTLRLGKLDKRTATATKLRVEALLSAKIQNVPIDRDTASWLAGIGVELAQRLAAVGLIEARDETTLAAFTEKYINKRTDIKPRTVRNLSQCRTRLIDFFGADKPLRSFSDEDAADWLRWLREKYAASTAGRAVKRARQFFDAARKAKMVDGNPFSAVRPPPMVNESRKAFVDRETFGRVLNACPDAETRLWLALCRYAGLRCPSEIALLRWENVNWERSRFYVTSPKTEHHHGKEGRWVPIFATLEPFLSVAFEQADEGEEYVLPRLRHCTGAALRSRINKILLRAAVDPWPKLFVNMRASCESELLQQFPIATVCRWIGHSIAVADSHYVQILDTDFERASKSDANSDAIGRKTTHFPTQTVRDAKELEGTQVLATVPFSPLESPQVLISPALAIPPRGLEPLS